MSANKLRSTSTSWTKGAWNPKEDFCKGDGITGQGKIIDLRFHTLISKQDIIRYLALVIEIPEGQIQRQTRDKYGELVFPDFENPHSQKKLSYDQVLKLIGHNGKPVPDGDLLSSTELNILHPNKKGVFEFWGEMSDLKKETYQCGDEVRFYTLGNSMFLKSITKTSIGSFSHLDGGEVMNQMSKFSDAMQKDQKLPQDEMEGCNDDEWDD
eukprot:TRINITY_DN3220_c0_g1_i1.p1 TRINITY_DN3220_c0_g1~~TRINITY_DN3220_c0_g1_i1.p1  ORF type:complete len:211 (+),score=47.77 TRINITY_DN3220_c0_g1_i1:54-686(+)